MAYASIVDLEPRYSPRVFAALVKRESNGLELKQGLGKRALQEAMVAFSNAAGGVVFIGVTDEGTVSGRSWDASVDDKIHEAALDARNVGRYRIHSVEVGSREVVAVTVARREEGFAQTSDGRVLVRRGARNVALYGPDLTEFIQARALRRFESSPTDVGIDAADPGLLDEMRGAFGWEPSARDLRERLYEQGLAAGEQLTIAGALFLTDPQLSLRQNKAVVEVRRHPADGPAYDRRVEISGPLHHQVRDATGFVLAELGTDVVVTGLYRHDLPRLPEIVVREAISNAVAHRSYETLRTPIVVELRPDRVVVTSPGGLPEPVTIQTLRQAQAARNQDVINVLRRFRLAEDAGMGIDVIEDTMLAAMLDPPEFSDPDGTAVRVVLPLRGPITPRERAWVADLERQGDVGPADRLLLVHAARGEPLTNRTARTVLHTSEREARVALHRLRDAGLLVQRGSRGGATYALARELAPPAAYRLAPEELADFVVAEARQQPLSNQALRELTGLDRDQALRLLRQLVAEGRLRRTGTRRGTRYHAV